jgi:RimJ/RimL family protein N-acetyltransferase
MKPILFDFPVPIETPRLWLRPPQIGDGPMVNEAILESLIALRPFMPWANETPSVDDTEEFVRLAAANWILKKNDEPYLPLFILDKQTNRFLGATGYHHFMWNVPCIETGYWLRNSSTGQGIMTEATNAVTRYAFKQLQVKRIAITCASDNHRSRKIPERLGYTLEAVQKSNRLTSENQLADTLVFTRHDLDKLPDLDVRW